MSARSSIFRVLFAASYWLTVATSVLFHHHGHDGDHQECFGFCASHGDEENECPVCQFLAQKPAPTAIVISIGPEGWVDEVFCWAMPCADESVFSAWHSRAPPVA